MPEISADHLSEIKQSRKNGHHREQNNNGLMRHSTSEYDFDDFSENKNIDKRELCHRYAEECTQTVPIR